MSLLPQYFDRIALISLAERGDRRERLFAHLKALSLAAPEDLTLVEAVNGRTQKLPEWWKSGSGAWGCRFSHLNALAAAHRDGVQRLLILEDDAIFHHHTAAWLPGTVEALPADWELFFLGGQHMEPPVETASPRLLLGRCITRTHAYAVHAPAFGKLLTAISDDVLYQANPGWHIDHQLGTGQSQGLWSAYAPAWWFAGQEEGQSNISRNLDTRRWWPPTNDYWQLPMILPQQPLGSPWLVVSDTPPPEETMPLALWFRKLAYTAWQQGGLPTCELPAEVVRKHWPGGVRVVHHEAEIAALADYPANGLFPHPYAGEHSSK
jgi:hypothetical protein